jgi:hypothetical protein
MNKVHHNNYPVHISSLAVFDRFCVTWRTQRPDPRQGYRIFFANHQVQSASWCPSSFSGTRS